MSVRSFVRPDNNWFLRRGYEGCRNAAGHWQFELWILAVLKKTEKSSSKTRINERDMVVQGPGFGSGFDHGLGYFFCKTWFFESRWYQGIESSRNQWTRSDVIWRVRIVGSELFDSPLEWIGERDRYSSNFEEVYASRPCLARCI